MKTISDFSGLSKPKYSLKQSLLSQKGSIIAECKKGSPSMGIIKADYDPVAIAEEYYHAGAKAISVLTDQKFFFGSLNDLKNVSEKIPLPVIRKDFIIHEKQISEARFYGASAILLIVRILEDSQMKDLLQFSHSLGMDVLVETHTKDEVDRALNAGAEIIGINTRDLDTFEIHPNLIEKIAPQIPNHILKVGESGIKNRTDYQDMIQHVHSVLIGTYFMQKNHITQGFQDLLSKS